MRSGAESSERQAHFIYIRLFLIILTRVKTLEAQVVSLEAETERMTRVLDTQKSLTVEMETSLRKKIDDFTKDLQRRVSCVVSKGQGKTLI